MKLFKKMKLVNAVITLVVIAVISMGANEFLAASAMKKVNGNMSNMYSNNLISIARIGAMRGAFLSIRIEANKAMLNYNTSYDEHVKNELGNINKYIKDYELTNMDDTEIKGINDFKSYIQQYMTVWDKVKSSLIKNEAASIEDQKSFEEIGNKIDTTLVSLRDYNETKAEKIIIQSNTFYKTSINILLLIFAFVILLYILISTFIIRVIRTSSKEVIQALNTVSKGDLTINIDDDGNNEFALMKKALSVTLKSIRIMIEQIKQSSLQLESRAEGLSAVSEEMSSGSNNVAIAIGDVAKGMSSQSEDIVNINTIFNDFNQQLEDVIDAMEDITVGARDVGDMAEDSNIKMTNLVKSIEKVQAVFGDFAAKINTLGTSVNRINEISNLINGIADQTNLLALNASIEAARAGEAGRGFAVVADEIRKLAEQSKTSSANINSVIDGISAETSVMISTSEEVEEEIAAQRNVIGITIKSFEEIIKGIKAVNPQITQISQSMGLIQEEKNSIVEKLENASSIAEEISASSEEIAASTEEMNASSEEVASTALELSGMTKDMLNAVNKFKL